MNVPGQTPGGKAPSAPLPLARPPRLRSAPCRRLESVAYQILEDAAHYDFRRHLKYSPLAVIEKVVVRRQSVASCGSSPSYLWATLALDEDGEPYPDIDVGQMPYSVLCPPRLHTYGSLKGTPNLNSRYWRTSMPGYEAAENGPWTLLTGDSYTSREEARQFPLVHAIPIGTRFLLRVCIIHTSFDGECDASIEPTILFIDPAPADVYLPVAIDDETAAAIGGNRHAISKWSIAP